MHNTTPRKSKKIVITVSLPKVRGARILGRNAIMADRRTKRQRTRGVQKRNAVNDW